MELLDSFNASVYAPNISTISAIVTVLHKLWSFNASEIAGVCGALRDKDASGISIGVKKLIYMIEFFTFFSCIICMHGYVTTLGFLFL